LLAENPRQQGLPPVGRAGRTILRWRGCKSSELLPPSPALKVTAHTMGYDPLRPHAGPFAAEPEGVISTVFHFHDCWHLIRGVQPWDGRHRVRSHASRHRPHRPVAVDHIRARYAGPSGARGEASERGRETLPPVDLLTVEPPIHDATNASPWQKSKSVTVSPESLDGY
jgi:hypothetical protein